MTDSMLELRGVSKNFGETRALQRVDLTIAAGRTTVLIGPSGCGKSTLLRLINGLLAPDEGTILFEGAEVASEDRLTKRRRMGYVIQDGGLFPHLTARENVTLVARYLRLPRDRVISRVMELTELARLPEDALDRFPIQLSGGQRSRVGLMRALMLDPDLLLLDEPLASLDPLIRSELQSNLRAIFATLGKTVVLVTHDVGEAGFLGEKIVLLKEGRVVQVGSLEELVKNPGEPFVTQFVNAQRSPLESLKGPEG